MTPHPANSRRESNLHRFIDFCPQGKEYQDLRSQNYYLYYLAPSETRPAVVCLRAPKNKVRCSCVDGVTSVWHCVEGWSKLLFIHSFMLLFAVGQVPVPRPTLVLLVPWAETAVYCPRGFGAGRLCVLDTPLASFYLKVGSINCFHIDFVLISSRFPCRRREQCGAL